MTYELAKKLKDAGFPQEHKFRLEYDATEIRGCPPCCGMPPPYHEGHDFLKCHQKVNPYFPTLSELIEACGDGLWIIINDRSVEYVGRDWVAVSRQQVPFPSLNTDWSSMMFDNKLKCRGQTPEEAVALLWLELRLKEK